MEQGDLGLLADQLSVPVSHLGSVADFFEEFRSRPWKQTDQRRCGDLPCALAAGFDESVRRPHPSEMEGLVDEEEIPSVPLSCLGRCHEAPVSLDRYGELQTAANHPEPVAARCLAAEGRLTRPSWEKEAAAFVETIRRERDPVRVVRRKLEATEGLTRHRRKAGRGLFERWQEAASTPAAQRFVVCHADAGNPGAAGGAWLLHRKPAVVIDGMILAGLLVGAKEGVICVHHDMPDVFTAVDEAVNAATEAGKLREDGFEISVIATFGSHVGGEETALLNAIEGRRGEARVRPPEPEIAGVFGLPTVIETAETFALLPGWLATGQDPGHRLMTLTPPFGRPGLVEIDASVPIRGALREGSSVLRKEKPTALLLGGPFGSLVFSEHFDLRLDAEILKERDISPGNWSLLPLPKEMDYRALVESWLDFAARESCGKCAPCRLGPLAAREMLESPNLRSRRRLPEVLDTIEATSLCGFGRNFPRPLRQLIDWIGVDDIIDGAGGGKT